MSQNLLPSRFFSSTLGRAAEMGMVSHGERSHISPKVHETHSVFISSCVGRRTAEIVMEGSYFAFFAEAEM